MKRLFFATKIELDDNFTSILQKLKKNTSFDTISWVEKENLHLTLRFLGKTPESKISTLIEQVTPIFQKQSTIELKMNRMLFSVAATNLRLYGWDLKEMMR